MTLVVAKTFDGEIRIVSDTHLTPVHDLHQTLLHGALKCIAASPNLCVSFAGNSHVAAQAIGPMLRNPAGQRNDLVTYLLDRHRQADFDTDYLVAFADYPPALCRVSEGRAVEQHGTSWIGDHRAFGKFQETYNSEMPQVDADAWQVWVSKMNNSMTAVINDPGIPSVAGFLVTVTSRSIERDGFRYLARSGGEGFLPVALTNEPTSLIRPVGAAGGGFRYSLLVPDGPGIPAIGVYIPEGPVGVLFSVTTTQVRAATIQDFMARVHDEFRITLDGPHWG